MADPVEEELIPVVDGEEPAKAPEGEGEAAGGAVEGDDDGSDDDDGGDTRLADNDEEEPENRKRRRERRERTRIKREETARELEALRQQNRDLAARLGTIEGHTLTANAEQIAARYNQTLEDIRQAEEIYAKAVSEGQGEYATQAMRIRDAAKDEAQRLAHQHQQVTAARQTPQVDPRTVSHAQEWIKDNPWYKADGSDAPSALTKNIDSQLASEGYDPAHRIYWEELTRRVTDALKPAAGGQASERRTGPPMGTEREHAPTTTRRSEIRVTPERKAAMIEAGIWDDPVRRQRVLREYRDYDKASAR